VFSKEKSDLQIKMHSRRYVKEGFGCKSISCRSGSAFISSLLPDPEVKKCVKMRIWIHGLKKCGSGSETLTKVLVLSITTRKLPGV